ncbi:lethal(3)malignant brain tumor-like protein 1 [Varroa destructor]|uniref:SAM domain-containing protein n=2 Tax=Varroa TaxID=62624 RepID=A0A7M7KFR4_VARDE|nr:lethal(3)malignant brain tumor-like protein 1 [Varroa destructor]
MPPGFSAGIGFMLGLQQGPLGGPLGPLGQMGHLSPVATSPGTTPSAPTAFNPAQLKHMEMVMSSNSSRDYSKYLRSLAAKYNSNNPLNESFNSSSPFSPPTPPVRPPTLRSPDSPVGGGRPLTGAHLSPRAGSEGQRSSPHSHVPPQAPHSPHSSQRSPAAGFNLADFSSSQTLLNLVRTHAQSSQLETYLKGAVKRPASSTQEGDPLDLSLSGPPVKRSRSPVSPASPSSSPPSPQAKDTSPLMGLSMGVGLLANRPRSRSPRCSSACANEEHQSLVVSRWTVDEVVSFVQAIDACAPYAEKFREQLIDGSILSALTEDHLTAHMGMRLGPALKLRQSLTKKMGHCSVCLHCLHCHGPSPAAQLGLPTTPHPPGALAAHHHATSSPAHSAGSPSPRSSPLAVGSLDALAGQPTPASSSPSPPPSHPSPSSTPTDNTNASN